MNQLSIFDFNETPDTTKKYDCTDYQKYIYERYLNDSQLCHNELFYNILISSYFASKDIKSSVEPKEQYEWFIKVFKSFKWHYFSDAIKVFSYQKEYSLNDTDYFVCVAVKNDYIVELCRTNDLNKLCAPACAINWYNSNGIKDYELKFLNYNEQEKQIMTDAVNNGLTLRDDYLKDRREYYFFKLLEINKYAHKRIDLDNKKFSFCSMEWSLIDMISYFESKYRD